MVKSYEIHDNGGRPFRVEIQGNKVSVWKNMDTFEKRNGKFVDIHKPEKHILEFDADAVFIGKKSPDGGYDGLKPKEAEGNSILLQTGSKYVYIGSEIYEFAPVKGDTIIKYYSNVGHSDVAYPYAIGKTHVYILLEKVAIPIDFFEGLKDIYEQFYDLKASRGHQEQKDKVIKLKTKMLQKRL